MKNDLTAGLVRLIVLIFGLALSLYLIGDELSGKACFGVWFMCGAHSLGSKKKEW